jgi:hypothetical protein
MKTLFRIYSIALIFFCMLLTQVSAKAATWYSIVEFETAMVKNGEIRIEKPSAFLKKACAIADPQKQIDFYNLVASKASVLSVVVDEWPVDGNGKVEQINLKLNYNLGGEEDMRYSEFFYRDKKECLKGKEVFKKWLEDQNKSFKEKKSRYD